MIILHMQYMTQKTRSTMPDMLKQNILWTNNQHPIPNLVTAYSVISSNPRDTTYISMMDNI